MKIWKTLDKVRTPATELTLTQSGQEFMILANGRTLMGSGAHGSEEALSRLGCAHVPEAPVVLVGGMGMGFTLRAALDVLPADATVVVAELLEAVVTWNRGPLGPLAGHPLDDPRVVVAQGDIADLLRSSNQRFDAILLDVDNGPVAFSQEANSGLYDDRGIATCRRALRPGGVLAVWSAWDDKKYMHRLRHGGFKPALHHVRARQKKGGPHHTIFIGEMTAEATEQELREARPSSRKHRRRKPTKYPTRER